MLLTTCTIVGAGVLSYLVPIFLFAVWRAGYWAVWEVGATGGGVTDMVTVFFDELCAPWYSFQTNDSYGHSYWPWGPKWRE